jgi:hypothetical protein
VVDFSMADLEAKMSVKLDHFQLHIYDADGDGQKWLMDLRVGGSFIKHERFERDYSSPEDAITSCRHVVKELFKSTKPKDK